MHAFVLQFSVWTPDSETLLELLDYCAVSWLFEQTLAYSIVRLVRNTLLHQHSTVRVRGYLTFALEHVSQV